MGIKNIIAVYEFVVISRSKCLRMISNFINYKYERIKKYKNDCHSQKDLNHYIPIIYHRRRLINLLNINNIELNVNLLFVQGVVVKLGQ